MITANRLMIKTALPSLTTRRIGFAYFTLLVNFTTRLDSKGILKALVSFSQSLYSSPTLIAKQDVNIDVYGIVEISEMLCFRCPAVCPIQTSHNLLDNSGFELSDKLIGPWSAGGGRVSVVSGHNSPRAASIKGRSVQLEQRVNGCEDQIYRATFDIKFVNTTALPKSYILELEVGSQENEFLLQRSFSAEHFNAWRTISFSFKGTDFGFKDDPKSPEVALSLAISTVSDRAVETIVDNASIILGSLLYPTTGDSLLENGGFESGLLSPWNTSSPVGPQGPKNYSIVQPGLSSGSNYAFFFDSGETQESNGEYFYYEAGILITQDYTTLPGVKYQLSFDFQTNHTDYILITAGDIEWQLYNEEFYGPYINNKTTTFSRVFTGSGKKELLKIEFEVIDYQSYQEGIQKVLLDNFEIKQLADQS